MVIVEVLHTDLALSGNFCVSEKHVNVQDLIFTFYSRRNWETEWHHKC